MGAIIAAFAADSGIVRNFTTWAVSGDNVPGDAASASITFASDGSISYSAALNDNTVPGSTSWRFPNVTGIGANYYIRLTATSGTFSTNGASSFTSLSSAVTATKAATTGAATVTFTIEIASDAGGSSIVFTSTGNTLAYTHT